MPGDWPASSDRRRVDLMIDRLALGAYAGRRAGTLSLGNLQRLALARALLHGPELLILDEPANGLDPAGVIEIRDLLRDLAQHEGVTVFMSSHILGEVDLLANRIGIVHRGRLVEELDSDALEQRRDRRLEVEARDLEAAETALLAAGLTPQTARRRATRTPRPDGPRGAGEGRRDPRRRRGCRRRTSRSPGNRSRSTSCASPATKPVPRDAASARQSRPSS